MIVRAAVGLGRWLLRLDSISELVPERLGLLQQEFVLRLQVLVASMSQISRE